MNLPIIMALVFLVTLGLGVSGLYFLVATPLARHKLKMRLTTPQVAVDDGEDGEPRDIVRRKTLIYFPALGGLAPKLEFFLQQAAVKMPVSTFLSIAAGAVFVTALVTFVMYMPLPAVLGLTAVAGVIPFWVVSFKRKRRFSAFQEQFPDAIDMLARAVRAGHAFNVAFSLIADEMSDPVAEEFRIAHRQQNLGMPMREALRNLAKRMPMADVRIFVTALQIQRESGGNLGEILDNLSTVIRERFRLLREVDVLTTEARFTMYVLMAVPFGATLVMYLTNPAYIMPLFTKSIGHKALAVGGIMQVVGYLFVRKIVKIKI